jgi:hypothetical protein
MLLMQKRLRERVVAQVINFPTHMFTSCHPIQDLDRSLFLLLIEGLVQFAGAALAVLVFAGSVLAVLVFAGAAIAI